MEKQRKLVIVGDSSFAEIAYEYFTHDSSYEVCAFSVERAYCKKESLLGLPLVPFETLVMQYPPQEYDIYIATVYKQLNRLRKRLYLQAKQWGYKSASYISSRAFVWHNVKLGEHCFIFENNVIQPFVSIGDNVVLWSGNHIGHHSTIKNHCFISSHVVISGHCTIEDNVFMGVNCTVADQVAIEKDVVLGAGSLILKTTTPDTVYKQHTTQPSSVKSTQIFKVIEEFI